MALDINAIRGRLNKLQNTQKKSDALWKPTPGKSQVRIVPYKFNKDNPFIELYFHYNVNNKLIYLQFHLSRIDLKKRLSIRLLVELKQQKRKETIHF